MELPRVNSTLILEACAAASREGAEGENRNVGRYDPLTPTIFHEEWWLESATNGNYQVAEVTAGGRTVGRLPFYITKRLGISMIRMPILTYFLGPAIDEGEGSANNRFLKRLEITRQLLDKSPRVSWHYVKCQSGITDVIAFQEHNFRTYVQFTHEIAPEPIETLWQKMRNKTRNVIRRAEERLSIRELDDPDEFVRLYEVNCSARGVANHIDSFICRQVISASLECGRGRLLAAHDNNNQVVAANFCVWDQVSSFYMLSTRTGDSGNGAISLLIWEAIKHAVRKGLIFDFAGLGTQGSVLLYTGFGGEIRPRYVAVRTGPLTRMIWEARSLFRRENYFY